MKIIAWERGAFKGVGLLDEGLVVDLSRHDPALADLGFAMSLEGQRLVERHAGRAADYSEDDVAFLPLLAPGARVFCVGLNYKDHADEAGKELPAHPTLFLRTHESLVGHGQCLLRPAASTAFDYEGELAVVIGRDTHHVSEADALDYVGGYTCCNEGSVRDFQKHSVTAMTGKNFDASGALGPWLVPATEIADPSQLTLVTRINGQDAQRSSTGLLIYSIPKVISYLSTCLLLRPGDVIATGTPAGVGAKRTPPLWLKAGDHVEVEISGIGTLANRVEDARA